MTGVIWEIVGGVAALALGFYLGFGRYTRRPQDIDLSKPRPRQRVRRRKTPLDWFRRNRRVRRSFELENPRDRRPRR